MQVSTLEADSDPAADDLADLFIHVLKLRGWAPGDTSRTRTAAARGWRQNSTMRGVAGKTLGRAEGRLTYNMKVQAATAYAVLATKRPMEEVAPQPHR